MKAEEDSHLQAKAKDFQNIDPGRLGGPAG